MAKLYCSEMAGRVADRAVQVFGGRGYMRENVAERMFRELRVERIWEGASELQRLIVARQLMTRGAVVISARARGYLSARACASASRRAARGLAFCAPSRRSEVLRRQDSNLNSQNQNLMCCRLHHDGRCQPVTVVEQLRS